MPNLAYRIDPVAKLNEIRDGVFRAVRFKRGGYPHRFLLSKIDECGSDYGVYRICFYSNMDYTRYSLETDFRSQGPSIVQSVCIDDVLVAGFNQSWDDGFNAGQAYMFWVVERLDGLNEKFSRAGISLSRFSRVDM